MRRTYKVLAGWIIFFILASVCYRFRWVSVGLIGIDPPPETCESVDSLNTYLNGGGTPSAYIGKVPLIVCAAEAESAEVISRLIEAGADVNAQIAPPKYLPMFSSRVGISALHTAVEKGNLEIAEILVEGGADINLEGSVGIETSPFELAVGKDQKEILNLFIETGDYPSVVGPEGIASASGRGNLSILEYLVEQGIRIHDEEGIALLTAALEGHLNTVEFLISQGVPLNSKTSKGFTPLHFASREGHLDVVKLLVSRGAYINAATRDGITPLQLAIRENHSEIQDFLLSQGADFNSSE